MNALDRINNLDKPKTDMSLDDQMAAVDAVENSESNEFFSGMSPMAKESIMSRSNVTPNKYEVTMEDVQEEFQDEQPKEEVKEEVKEEAKMDKMKANAEEQFNYNTEEKKQRGRPKQREAVASSESASAYDPIIAQLAKNIVVDLKKQNYSYGGFSASQTKLILDYILHKL